MRQERTKRIVVLVGTRPEAIKMAPVVRELQKARWASCRVLLTGQHRALVHQMLEFFGIEADLDLEILRSGPAPDELAARLVAAIGVALVRERPDMLLVQGDTTSVAAAALAGFHLGIPLGHVEAGLRSHRLFAPFPEEANRVIASHLSALHFAPTESARENLRREGIAEHTIHVTGNTVIDALLATSRRRIPLGVELDARKRLLVVTVHRRESFGAPLRAICRAIQAIHHECPDVEILWPVHPNPAVKPVVREMLAGFDRVHLCEPLPYGRFVAALKRAALVLTDSGGLQEEAPALGKPVLVLREETERSEAIELGLARLVGYDPDRIASAAAHLLNDGDAYRKMARGVSPYGDGRSAPRIVAEVAEFLDAGPMRQTSAPQGAAVAE
jgi:UDP-N-acetylglucosamine 2-epimerase (non-hydrolysing)